MRRVDRDRRQQRIDFALEIVLGELVGFVAELIPFQQPDVLLAQLRQQAVVPAGVLRVHEGVDFRRQRRQRLIRPQARRSPARGSRLRCAASARPAGFRRIRPGCCR